MKRFLYLLSSIVILSGCIPAQWYGIICVKNCTESPIYIKTNAQSCSSDLPYRDSEMEYEVLPGRYFDLGMSVAYLDQSLVTLESMIANYNDAYVTISSKVDGMPASRTWTYADRNDGNKQLFRLNDCAVDEATDPRKNFTGIYFFFNVEEVDLHINN